MLRGRAGSNAWAGNLTLLLGNYVTFHSLACPRLQQNEGLQHAVEPGPGPRLGCQRAQLRRSLRDHVVGVERGPPSPGDPRLPGAQVGYGGIRLLQNLLGELGREHVDVCLSRLAPCLLLQDTSPKRREERIGDLRHASGSLLAGGRARVIHCTGITRYDKEHQPRVTAAIKDR